MTDRLRKRFRDRPLATLTPEDWETCGESRGTCCLNKLEDEEAGEVALFDAGCGRAGAVRAGV